MENEQLFFLEDGDTVIPPTCINSFNSSNLILFLHQSYFLGTPGVCPSCLWHRGPWTVHMATYWPQTTCWTVEEGKCSRGGRGIVFKLRRVLLFSQGGVASLISALFRDKAKTYHKRKKKWDLEHDCQWQNLLWSVCLTWKSQIYSIQYFIMYIYLDIYQECTKILQNIYIRGGWATCGPSSYFIWPTKME